MDFSAEAQEKFNAGKSRMVPKPGTSRPKTRKPCLEWRNRTIGWSICPVKSLVESEKAKKLENEKKERKEEEDREIQGENRAKLREVEKENREKLREMERENRTRLR